MIEKKGVNLFLTRIVHYEFKGKLTQEDYENLKSHIDNESQSQEGANWVFTLGKEIGEPSEWEDDAELESEWDE